MDKLEKFDVEKLNGLLNRAREYKEQANIINDTYNDMQGYDDGRARLYIRINGMKTVINLDADTVNELLIVLHKRYKSIIRETKQEVDKLYEMFLGEHSCAEKPPMPKGRV